MCCMWISVALTRKDKDIIALIPKLKGNNKIWYNFVIINNLVLLFFTLTNFPNVNRNLFKSK